MRSRRCHKAAAKLPPELPPDGVGWGVFGWTMGKEQAREVPEISDYVLRYGPRGMGSFGDADRKAPRQPEHREIATDEGQQPGIGGRIPFDQQTQTDGERLTDQHAYDENDQQAHGLPLCLDCVSATFGDTHRGINRGETIRRAYDCWHDVAGRNVAA